MEKLIEAGRLKGYASSDLRSDSEGRTQKYYTLLSRREVKQLVESGQAEEFKQVIWIGNVLSIVDWPGYINWAIENVRHDQEKEA